MKTSTETKLIRSLLNALRDGDLVPNPDFQRNLVWSNKDKIAFIDTVLKGFPFPEIYIAVGEVDLKTAHGIEMLVDGQQRITTLHQYFSASKSLELAPPVCAYIDLSPDQQRNFLNYEVAVRNLGIVSSDEIKQVFLRINATSYSVNAMETHNARYRGPLKQCADEISEDDFFEAHKMFSAREIRRMDDVVYSLTIIICILSNYFNRKDELEVYLERFNDEFPDSVDIKFRFNIVKKFIELCQFHPRSRAWKKTDFLVLFIELDRLINKENILLDTTRVSIAINSFYERINQELENSSGDDDLQTYFKTTVQATNDRTSRVNRGRVIRKVILAA